jgi:hypothetical protein
MSATDGAHPLISNLVTCLAQISRQAKFLGVVFAGNSTALAHPRLISVHLRLKKEVMR